MQRSGKNLIWLWFILGPSAWATPAVTATATASAGTLDLDGEGSSGTYIVKVADATFSTDNPTGCTLTVSSGDITKVRGADVAYQVTSVANNAAAPTAGDFSVPSGNDYTFSISTATSSNRDIYVKYTTRNLQDPGSYGETVQFSVADN